MSIEFTGAERVLFRSTYEFAIEVLRLSDAEAREMAMNKIIKTRALVRVVAKH